MQLLKWFSLMKGVVMCDKNLTISLLKHFNCDFALSGAGDDTYLKSDFQEGRVTKIFNFALKIKGSGREGGTCEVLRPSHPPKFKTCTYQTNSLLW